MAFALRRLITPALQSSALRAKCASNSVRLLGSSNEAATATIATAAPKANAGEQKLNVSDSCLKRLREICKDGAFLRITVEGGGCSGFQYKFDLDSKSSEDDVFFGEDKAKVGIDAVSLEYCAGSTVDYHTELIRSGFRMVANPQAEQGCSCGASFAIKLN